MKVPTKSQSPNNRLAYLEKLNEREVWYKLVVKIISWKDPLLGENPIKVVAKITVKEWNTYYQRMVKTNVTYNKQKVLSDLKETKEIIEKRGGFEE